ncbi:hypothetical protein EZ456_04085 [Pedobacter psychrodurus]|uniref:Uncharacterized protein n=1 Tax=Pedobacter psychrodurus TaxID=2530456 RepID=A0A4V2MR86_9SPHI|nr:hypothetical protein [Pedobacter psychrodurus]TCD28577.1 hypothetical protein EZ456_04085 [Pedobacter psychrodurus]
MKNLTYLTTAILLLTFSACKKEKIKKEEPKATIDIKQYFISGTYLRTIGNKNFEHPYLVTFEENGQAKIYDWGAVSNIAVNYTFENNKITVNYGGASNWVFTIADENISKAEGLQQYYLSSNLYKIPGTNQFTGNWYSGIMMSRENGSSMFFSYKFTDSQYQETVHISATTYTYTAIKNVMAIATENGIARYFLALNGKLMVSRYNFGVNPPANFFFAAFTKDQ